MLHRDKLTLVDQQASGYQPPLRSVEADDYDVPDALSDERDAIESLAAYACPDCSEGLKIVWPESTPLPNAATLCRWSDLP